MGLVAQQETSPTDPDKIAFFENRIRPVLVKHCYECHSEKSDDVSGGLLLDSRSAIRKGGDSGPAVVPGDPDKSLLLEAMSYEDRDLQMPPDSKLSPKIVADFRVWIQSGAVDPRSATTGKPKNEFNLQQRRAEHWAWHFHDRWSRHTEPFPID